MLQKEIEAKLKSHLLPNLDKNSWGFKHIKKLAIFDDRVEIDLLFSYPILSIKDEIIANIRALLSAMIGTRLLQVTLHTEIDSHSGNQTIPLLPNIKNIIAVSSGKGGVGKSMVAIHLAKALQQEGVNVGLLDADIYGPSQPTMLGTVGQKPVALDGKLQPIVSFGMQTMSIGYLVNQQVPLAWRGPMIGKAMQQMLYDTAWRNLDYLVIDLPPGTGDIQLTLCQKVPVSGAVIVTTPQDLALIDVRRACEMFAKLNVPILGVIENMSIYQCSACGHAERVFGEGGAIKLTEQYKLALLGTIPLDSRLRQLTDGGAPDELSIHNPYANMFALITRKLTMQLSLQTKNYSNKFPKIVVEQQHKMDN